MHPVSHHAAPAVLPLCAALIALALMAACDGRMPGSGSRPSIASVTAPLERAANRAAASVITPASAAVEIQPERLMPMSLVDKVKAAFMADAALRNSAIGVKEAQGVVTLYGTVDTSANRDRAARIAYAVEGTKYVKSNLLITSAW